MILAEYKEYYVIVCRLILNLTEFNIGNYTLVLFTVAVATKAFVNNYRYNTNISTSHTYRNHNRTDSSPFKHRNSTEGQEDPEYGDPQLLAHKYKYVQVTLEKDTPNVGKKGEIVHVNRSYAFNYLVPFGFARYTSRAELIGLALDRDYKEALSNIRKTAALQLKNKLGRNLLLEFQVPSSNKDSSLLNSPLRPIHIIQRLRDLKYLSPLDMLREQDVKINTESGLIKKFGTYQVTLLLDEDIESVIKVKVTDIPVTTVVLNDKL